MTQDLNTTPAVTPITAKKTNAQNDPPPPPGFEEIAMDNSRKALPGAIHGVPADVTDLAGEVAVLKAGWTEMQESIKFLVENARKEAVVKETVGESQNDRSLASRSLQGRESRHREKSHNSGRIRSTIHRVPRREDNSVRPSVQRAESQRDRRTRESPPRLEKRMFSEDELKEFVQQQIKKVKGGEGWTEPGDEWLANLVKTPFVKTIIETRPPSRFALPKFELYDGTTDPIDHILHYLNVMTPLGLTSENRDATLCKSFGSSLKGAALSWLNGLPSESIDSFDSLMKLFKKQFETSSRFQKDSEHLFNIKQKKNESIKSYAFRFNKEKVGIPDCVESTAVNAYRKGLRPGQCYDELTGTKPTTMVEALARSKNSLTLRKTGKTRVEMNPITERDIRKV